MERYGSALLVPLSSFADWPRGCVGRARTVTTQNASKRYIVDSSGWVEYLGDGPKAEAFARFFQREEALFLPTIIVYEVFKKLLRERGASLAEEFFSQARQLADST